MRWLYSCETEVGTIYIVTNGDYYHPEFEGATYGAYESIYMLLEDLVGGHTFSFPRGIDTADLEIPEELDEWEKID